MKRLSISFLAFSIALVLVLLGGPGVARAEETEVHPVGVGYKIGNGIGFLGADLIVREIPHLAFDLQANYLSESIDEGYGSTETATGYGFAPTVQLQLKSFGHTPYLGIGFAYVHLSMGDVTGSASALLVNLGYEWRFASGVGVLLGGGLADIGNINARGADGSTINESGGAHFNIEAGVRYYF